MASLLDQLKRAQKLADARKKLEKATNQKIVVSPFPANVRLANGLRVGLPINSEKTSLGLTNVKLANGLKVNIPTPSVEVVSPVKSEVLPVNVVASPVIPQEDPGLDLVIESDAPSKEQAEMAVLPPTDAVIEGGFGGYIYDALDQTGEFVIDQGSGYLSPAYQQAAQQAKENDYITIAIAAAIVFILYKLF